MAVTPPSTPAELFAGVKASLISEGLCPDCRWTLIVAADGWAVCVQCSVAHRVSGRGDSFQWASRMVKHWSLEPLNLT